ncbi:MAG: S9 family peptidase [Novosphingobium sp.]|nr:S9 family peptidase [Novosphingobium sp.]
MRRCAWGAAAGLLALRPAAGFAGDAPSDAASPSPPVAAPQAAPADGGARKQIPTSLFAERSQFGSPLISPDGSKIALRLTVKGEQNVAAMDLATKKILYMAEMDATHEIDWFAWAGNDRLLVSVGTQDKIYDVDVRVTRLFALDVADKALHFLGPKRLGIEGDDVLYTDPAGKYVLLSYSRDIFTEPEVWRFPLDTGGPDKPERILGSQANVWQWIADDDGTVRIGLGWSGTRLVVRYRRSADDGFKIIGRLSRDADSKDELWDVLRIIGGSDEGYMLDDGDHGHVALRKFNYATRQTGEVVYENPDWDVTDFDLDDDGKPVAVYYTDDRDHVVWLDPKVEKLQKALQKALDSPDVWIGSRSKDDTQMIVWSGGPTDPGAAFLYDAKTHKLDIFGEARPGLAPGLLAPVKPVSYTARDGTAIHAYLTLPPGRPATGLPLILLPHGGPYGVRDKLEYNDEVQLLASRGYAVLQPNYRGSGGYGETFEKLGDGQIGRTMQDDLDDAMDWAVAQGIADPKRVCVDGSSYGGYAALWAVMRNPERYRCAASFAGVTDWDSQLRYDADFFTAKGRKSWRTRIRGEDRKFDLDTVSPARKAATLTRPVLIAHGKIDGNVPFSQFEKLKAALDKAKFAKADYLVFDKEGHGFDTAEDEQRWYDALIAFLAKNDPPD